MDPFFYFNIFSFTDRFLGTVKVGPTCAVPSDEAEEIAAYVFETSELRAVFSTEEMFNKYSIN